jgi:hypothetical protein
MLYKVDKKNVLELREHRVPCNGMRSIESEQFEEHRKQVRERERQGEKESEERRGTENFSDCE